jgi:SEC-C motif-containing protein
MFKYTGLKILDSRPPDENGVARVLFFAKVFQNGRNLSIVELSDFVREEAGWRYRGGVLKPVASLGVDPLGLTIETFST